MSDTEFLWCETHGMSHYGPGDPDCDFRDIFGEVIEP